MIHRSKDFLVYCSSCSALFAYRGSLSVPTSTICPSCHVGVFHSVDDGFGGRVFLTKEEWTTYRRRAPVRYIKRVHAPLCFVCELPASAQAPFQHAHRIGFKMGVLVLGLTPDFVDSSFNIVTAHRRRCNGEAELCLEEAIRWLKQQGVPRLPTYLPKETTQLWKQVDRTEK